MWSVPGGQVSPLNWLQACFINSLIFIYFFQHNILIDSLGNSHHTPNHIHFPIFPCLIPPTNNNLVMTSPPTEQQQKQAQFVLSMFSVVCGQTPGGLTIKQNWTFFSFTLSHCKPSVVESSFFLPSMRFMEKFQFLVGHCFHSLRANRKDTNVSLEFLPGKWQAHYESWMFQSQDPSRNHALLTSAPYPRLKVCTTTPGQSMILSWPMSNTLAVTGNSYALINS